jgi:hypothetical protein
MTAVTTDPPLAPAPRRRRWVRALLALVLAAIAAMWIYAFAFAPRQGVNLVEDPAWVQRAEATCTAYADQLEPLIFRERVTEANKAETLPRFVAQLDQAVPLLEQMIADLDAIPRASERSATLVPQWLADYRLFVNDLAQWREQLRAGRVVQFGVTRAPGGIPIDEKLATFATENKIKSCQPAHVAS